MKRLYRFLPVLTIIAIIAIWYIAALAVGTEIVLPMPHSAFSELILAFGKGSFYIALLSCLGRAVLSFSAALVLGIVLASLSVRYKAIEKLLSPIIIIVRAVPTMSVIFLFIIWFTASLSPIFVAFTVIFPLIYNSSLSALKSCDKSLVEMTAIYKVERKTALIDFFVPYMASKVYSDSVSTLPLCVKLVVAAEALANTRLSLGAEMRIANISLETAQLFAYTLAAILLSFLVELVLRLIKKIVLRLRYAKVS